MGLLKWLGLELGPEKEPLEITDANFSDLLRKSATPLLVDAWLKS